jgi:hypothetical protein
MIEGFEFRAFHLLREAYEYQELEILHLREIIEQFCMDADNHRHAYWRPRNERIVFPQRELLKPF